jgi:short-subunit dehydrogenase
MRRDLRGLRVLITGASGGIGKALAEQAAAAGARVALAARSADKLDEAATALAGKGADVVAVAADVTLADDRQRLLDTVVARFDGLDVLINNAGVGSFGHFATGTEDVLRRVMEVNFFAPAELCRLVVPLLLKGRQPAIVNVSSMCGRRGMPAWSEYSASKHALVGLSEALRGEYARFGIDVLLVLPGLTASGLWGGLLRNEGRYPIDYRRALRPEQTAAGTLDALRRNRRETVLGRDARWILFFHHWCPWLVNRLLARKVKQLYAAG